MRPPSICHCWPVWLLLGAGPALAQQFAAPQLYPSGAGEACSVAVGDVNGDGRADLVTANGEGNQIGVLLGRQAGGFAPVRTYPTGPGSSPEAVALGDLNGDGRPDVIVGNFGTHSVGVLLGRAGGTFAPVRLFALAAGTDPVAVAAGDANGDGRTDLATANLGPHNVGLLLGQAAGGLAPARYLDTAGGQNAADVALADISGDGRPDLVLANMLANSVGVRLGQAGGGFAPVVLYDTGEESIPNRVEVGDVNGDRIPDLITANLGRSAIGVLLGTGQGLFASYATYPTYAAPAGEPVGKYGRPFGLSLGDVNGDGQPDAAALNSDPPAVAILLGLGGGRFGEPTLYPLAELPRHVVLADVNSDGQPDLVVANRRNATVGVLLNMGTRAARPRKSGSLSPPAVAPHRR